MIVMYDVESDLNFTYYVNYVYCDVFPTPYSLNELKLNSQSRIPIQLSGRSRRGTNYNSPVPVFGFKFREETC